jgi:signal transduction histidine kinase
VRAFRRFDAGVLPLPSRPYDFGTMPTRSTAPGQPVTGSDLQGIETLEGLGVAERDWIASQCELVVLEPGEMLFEPGAPADSMFLCIEGVMHLRRELHANEPPLFSVRAGEITGTIPFSRMVSYPLVARAATRVRVARFPKSAFPDLLHRIPALEPKLVALLADRVRETTKRDQQQEKLTALGRLAAGLAHELNNPAAAAHRAATDLRVRLDDLNRRSVELADTGVSCTSAGALDQLRSEIMRSGSTAAIDPVERSDREDVVAQWLEREGLAEPWIGAATFVGAGVDVPRLEAIVAPLPSQGRKAAIEWLECALAADALLTGVENAAKRIADLVGAVKSFTRMDRQGDVAEVDVHEGLETTLALFSHRLRDHRVVLTRAYARGLPAVRGSATELNQVWANLIANAIDAAGEHGHVAVRTTREGTMVAVEVTDDGPGVPMSIQERIWEPFFTTKPVGQGTGLGLDISRRIIEEHGGEITLESKPGDTRFTVRLPLTAAA